MTAADFTTRASRSPNYYGRLIADVFNPICLLRQSPCLLCASRTVFIYTDRRLGRLSPEGRADDRFRDALDLKETPCVKTSSFFSTSITLCSTMIASLPTLNIISRK